MIKNANFQGMIEGKPLDDEEKVLLINGIKAFSEYMVAIDPEYKYNKTFLSGFAEEFVGSIAQFQKKKKIFEDVIIKPFEDYFEEVTIIMDDVWICEKGEIDLSNKFNLSLVNSDEIQYQIKHFKSPEFVIAQKTNVANAEKNIQEDLERFLSRTEKKDNE